MCVHLRVGQTNRFAHLVVRATLSFWQTNLKEIFAVNQKHTLSRSSQGANTAVCIPFYEHLTLQNSLTRGGDVWCSLWVVWFGLGEVDEGGRTENEEGNRLTDI